MIDVRLSHADCNVSKLRTKAPNVIRALPLFPPRRPAADRCLTTLAQDDVDAVHDQRLQAGVLGRCQYPQAPMIIWPEIDGHAYGRILQYTFVLRHLQSLTSPDCITMLACEKLLDNVLVSIQREREAGSTMGSSVCPTGNMK